MRLWNLTVFLNDTLEFPVMYFHPAYSSDKGKASIFTILTEVFPWLTAVIHAFLYKHQFINLESGISVLGYWN